MANKRVTELTALDGDDVADNDLLMIVDVSDPTMAATGTNKRITVAEFATDSTLGGAFVAKSTLTTDGDMLTRASGVPARITRADLAQDSAFSSRYAPLASDGIWARGTDLTPILNSPSVGTLGAATDWTRQTPAMLFDASTYEATMIMEYMPQGWATYDVYLWWSNAGAGSGDVVWQFYLNAFNSTANTDAANTGAVATVAAPAQYVLKRTKINSAAIAATPGQMLRLVVARAGTDGNDTLGNDCGVVAIEWVRAS